MQVVESCLIHGGEDRTLEGKGRTVPIWIRYEKKVGTATAK